MAGYLKNFWEQLDTTALVQWLQRGLAVLICLTIHETCHGLVALALGDPTAKKANRLSFNPLRHIDWLGLAAMLLCGFGWAKPVPVDMRYFRNPRAGMALTALAGPVSNFLLALLSLFLASLVWRMPVGTVLLDFLFLTAILSIGLGIFNLIPIPPLDGSKVLFAFLPEKVYNMLMRYERFGMLLLLLLVWLDVGGSWLSNGIEAVYLWMAGLFFP